MLPLTAAAAAADGLTAWQARHGSHPMRCADGAHPPLAAAAAGTAVVLSCPDCGRSKTARPGSDLFARGLAASRAEFPCWLCVPEYAMPGEETRAVASVPEQRS